MGICHDYKQTIVLRKATIMVFQPLQRCGSHKIVYASALPSGVKSIGLPVCYSEYGDTPDESQLREAAEKLVSDSAFTVDELVDIYKSCMSQA